MGREIGHIAPDMTLTKAEIAADRAAWDALEAENARLRAALQQIADGYIDEGGGRRIHPDTLIMAREALTSARQ